MATSLPTDVIYSNTLPLEAVTIYSKATEIENRPHQAYENGAWLESKPEFAQENSKTVYWTTYRGFNPAVEPLSETEDKDSLGYTSFQVHFDMDTYGTSIQWSRNASEFHYTLPELETKIRTVLGPNMAETQDVLCRNAMIDGLTSEGRVTYLSGSGLPDIPETAYLSTLLVEELGEALLEDNNMGEGEVIALGQRRAFLGITKDDQWYDVKKYANPQDIIRGEEGSWHNVRFVRAPMGVLRNLGAVVADTELTAACSRGAAYITVDDTTGFEAGQLVTIGTPGGADEDAEEFRIATVNAMNGRLTVADKGGLRYDHAEDDAVTEALDLYPIIFMVSGIKPFGKGVVVPPYIGLTPGHDKMQRIQTLFWFGIFGYGVIRPWAAWCVWVAAPKYELLNRV